MLIASQARGDGGAGQPALADASLAGVLAALIIALNVFLLYEFVAG